jgi:predicted nucleic acid-binding protein
MSNIVIDSSVFISNFGQDKFTATAKSFIQIIIKNSNLKILLPTVIIAETLIICSRLKPSPNLQEIKQNLTLFETVDLDLDFLDHIAKFFSKEKSLLKTSDLIIALTAKLHSATLITWDKQLLSQTICPVTTPENFK